MAQQGYTSEEPPEVLNATPARQGMRGRHVLWVLIISSLLAAMALFASWAMRSPDLAAVSPNNKATVADAQKSDAAPPNARQNEVK
jgi:hypothetical protein